VEKHLQSISEAEKSLENQILDLKEKSNNSNKNNNQKPPENDVNLSQFNDTVMS